MPTTELSALFHAHTLIMKVDRRMTYPSSNITILPKKRGLSGFWTNRRHPVCHPNGAVGNVECYLEKNYENVVWVRWDLYQLVNRLYLVWNQFVAGNNENLWFYMHSQGMYQWASYQIRKIAGCACAGNAGNVFPRRRFQRKLLVSDPGMHHGTCVMHVPWCMSVSLTCGDG